MVGRLVILKLGGSVITDKTRRFTANHDAIKRLSKEISEANVRPLIIVHGAGSYGHPLAREHRLAEGLKDVEQWKGFILTRQAVGKLNMMIIDALLTQGVNAVAFPPSAFTQTRRGKINVFDTTIIQRALQGGLTPVLHGDVVFDEEQGVAILSGDQIASVLAVSLKAERIVIATDVDGLYTKDPKVHPEAVFLPQVSLTGIEKLLREPMTDDSVLDVTGHMIGKLHELKHSVEVGVRVEILNALEPNRLYCVLIGEPTIATKISRL